MALSYGNGDNASIVAESTIFLQHWEKTIDTCVKHVNPTLATVCLGVAATIYVKSPGLRTKLIRVGAPKWILLLVQKYVFSTLRAPQSIATYHLCCLFPIGIPRMPS